MELTLTTALLLSAVLPLVSAEKVIGTYIFHRHGDRTTKSYTPVTLTPLGQEQVFASGSYYRNLYLSESSSLHIANINSTIAHLSQLTITAPVDNVLQNSAQVFAQALYPPTSLTSQTLANGTVVEGPLNGYQYIPVNTVSSSSASSNANSESNAWLQAGSGCGKAVVSSNNYFTSASYLDTLSSTTSFYQSLLPVIQSTFPSAKANFKNAYTIYDYVHVSTIHNASIPSSSLLTSSTLHQLQTRADQHEFGLAFNASEPIRAIAGSVLAGQVLQFLNNTLLAQSSSSAPAPVLGIQFGAYASFLSFFGLADLPSVSENFTGIVDYASSLVFELVSSSDDSNNDGDYSVRFLFSNGTASTSNPPKEFPLFGKNETTLPWDDFVREMEAFAVKDTVSWCKACGETTGSCAVALGLTGNGNGNGTATTAGGDTGAGKKGGMSKAVAGVIGALVTLVVILGIEGLVMAVAGLRVVKKRVAAGRTGGADVAQEVKA